MVDKPTGRKVVFAVHREIRRRFRLRVPRKSQGKEEKVLQSKMFLFAIAAIVPMMASSQNKTYTVRQGDTISEIASRLKVRRAELIAANALPNSNVLQPGMILRIPARQPDATPLAAPKGAAYYTVRNGDFDWSLARKNGTTISQLKKLNPGVDFGNLQIGTRIALPASGRTSSVAKLEANKTKTAVAKVGTAKTKVALRTHKVVEGEFDWIIAKHAGVSLSALHRANPNMDLEKLHIGQVIHVPIGSIAGGNSVPATTRVAKNETGPTIKPIRSTYAIVAGNGSTIRREAGVHGDRVASVDAGTQVKVLDRDGAWYKLKFPKGTVGWMRGDLLKPLAPTIVAKERKTERIARATKTHSTYASHSSASTRRSTKPQVFRDEPISIVAGGNAASKAIKLAMSQRGKRYIWSSTDPSRGGFDCSGLVNWAYRNSGVKLPRTSIEMSGKGQKVSRDNLKPGDLLFFRTHRSSRVNHVALYIGGGKFVHSSSGYGGVKTDSLSGYYGKALAGARRVTSPATTAKGSKKPKAPKPDADAIATE